jgi:uncharacterized membrane protein
VGYTYWRQFPYGPGFATAFRYDAATNTWLNLGAGQARFVNSAGHVVGQGQAGLHNWWLWNGTSHVPLTGLCYATGFNNSGTVIGQVSYGPTSNCYPSRGAVWQAGVITDLPLLGLALSGVAFEMTEAYGINANGDVIGYDYNNYECDPWYNASKCYGVFWPASGGVTPIPLNASTDAFVAHTPHARLDDRRSGAIDSARYFL